MASHVVKAGFPVRSSNNGIVSFFMELKPQLSTVHMVLEVTPDMRDAEITLEGSEVQLIMQEKSITFKCDPLIFITPSCHGLQFNGECQMNCMLRVEPFPSVEQAHNGHDAQGTVNNRMSKDKRVDCTCKQCGSQLFSRKFERILPLPSDDWSEAVDGWFCHRHSKEECEDLHIDGATLGPKITDCFIGQLYFVVNASTLMENAVHRLTESHSLSCQRCRSPLGEIVKNPGSSKTEKLQYTSVKLFYGSTNTHQLEENHTPEEQQACPTKSLLFSERDFVQHLLGHMRDMPNFRFILECRTDGKIKPYTLLWVLDSQTLLYRESVRLQSGHKKQQVAPLPIIKVLYRECFLNRYKELSSMWQRDMGVESIELPPWACRHILKVLIQSTQSMPAEMAKLSGFNVGFLHR